MNNHSLSAERRRKTVLSVVLGIICIIYVLPVLTVVINSFKINTYVKTDTFALPNAESFANSSKLSATSITSRQSPRIMLFSAISSSRAMVEFQKPFML